MTSTNFNVGLVGEKNSSKVLRPPGGGHSDIFGITNNQNDIITPSKKRNHPQSTIGTCFNMVEETKEKPNDDEIDSEEEKEKNEVDNGTDENTAPSEIEEIRKSEEKPAEQVAVPKRVRVPPGGFSSAFW